MKPSFNVLFACMGNICRSPTAHGVFRARVRSAGLAATVRVDSAGTHNFHPGEPPDPRSQRHARRRGYDLSDLRARAVMAADFETADLILVMDEENLAASLQRCPQNHRPKLHRLTSFCRVHQSAAVPDPYYGADAGFERVLDLIEDACDGVLAHVRERLMTPPVPTAGSAC